MARWLFMMAVLGLLAPCGCGVSASVNGGVISNNGPYLGVWEPGWKTVERDQVAYMPTSTSPGACKLGGIKSACYEADQRVAADLKRLAAGLRKVEDPAQYRQATALTLKAIAASVKGLSLRMLSLHAGNYTMAQRELWFHESRAKLLEGHNLIQRAYAAFPDWARPMPAPSL